MSADDPLLDRAAIEHAFCRLGDRLARRGVKVLAARRRDSDDIRLLVKHLALSTVEDALALCAEVFPDEEVSARARLVLEDSFDDH